jgi:hypothetical protein
MRPPVAFISCLSVSVVLLILAIGTQAIGMGDIKTGAWIAMLAGWQGPTAVLVATVGPFLLQALIALVLVIAGSTADRLRLSARPSCSPGSRRSYCPRAASRPAINWAVGRMAAPKAKSSQHHRHRYLPG